MKSQLLILDFGSQYTKLIARAIRELGVFCHILPGETPVEEIIEHRPKAIILSGGPASVRAAATPRVADEVLALNIPVLGICYGMQLIAEEFGGKVGGLFANGEDGTREYGSARITIENPIGPFASFESGCEQDVWMSHGDKLTQAPAGFATLARSDGSPVAAFGHKERKIYGIQFHPEVHHTTEGKQILGGFLFDVAGLEKDWEPHGFVEETVAAIRKRVPEGNIICALSGGVDSVVAAMLIHKAVGKRLYCIFVDNGLLRAEEAQEVMHSMKGLGLNIRKIAAEDHFLRELSEVTDPEEKRKIIGRVFIEIFDGEAQGISEVRYLAQGTLYPDVIESGGVGGGAAMIKSHHNVGGLVENMKLTLIEPLRELFKDEVREIGREMGIPGFIIERQPFPGPGLAVRCLGEVSKDRLERLRGADRIVTEEVSRAELTSTIWQAFAILLPLRSVGVMGDGRTFEECVAIRAVTSRDGMTADWYALPENLLRKISSRIVNECEGVNRVVLDISSKPPATIEWE